MGIGKIQYVKLLGFWQEYFRVNASQNHHDIDGIGFIALRLWRRHKQ